MTTVPRGVTIDTAARNPSAIQWRPPPNRRSPQAAIFFAIRVSMPAQFAIAQLFRMPAELLPRAMRSCSTCAIRSPSLPSPRRRRGSFRNLHLVEDFACRRERLGEDGVFVVRARRHHVQIRSGSVRNFGERRQDASRSRAPCDAGNAGRVRARTSRSCGKRG